MYNFRAPKNQRLIVQPIRCIHFFHLKSKQVDKPHEMVTLTTFQPHPSIKHAVQIMHQYYRLNAFFLN